MFALALRRVCRCAQTTSFRQYSRQFASQDDHHWDRILSDDDRHSNQPRSPEELWKRRSDIFLSAALTGNVSNAYTGRSVDVKDGDVAQAAKVLDKIIAQNSVARDWFTNRRHKQKGEERRKTKSLRWRKQFKHEVGKKVELVQQIRRRGA